ncbi:CLUMA_CG002044, isoform A [Clunio marinus]|uniref:CLUMA_CG002044, isoform A n=1 Tax=Clunio marinus TaxID=568069 RepID=A0A1J1HJM6_9DIPT|nr:CLUMA_CG002044, isoform A [Clunio marinus]
MVMRRFKLSLHFSSYNYSFVTGYQSLLALKILLNKQPQHQILLLIIEFTLHITSDIERKKKCKMKSRQDSGNIECQLSTTMTSHVEAQSKVISFMIASHRHD